MSQNSTLNTRILLARRPQGAPVPEDFRLEKTEIPEIQSGQMLLKTLYLSLDPYMRGRMSEGPSYAASLGIGDVMIGGTVCRIESSMHPDFKEGDVVLGYAGWQEYSISDGNGLSKLDLPQEQLSLALGVLGMPGFTAYMGLLDIGEPKEGETVVVAAATGAVGAVVGQIAKLRGCHVIGIAGGTEKCAYAVEELGFDVCLDHKELELPQRLSKACPNGIDVYFENVGGAVFDAVLPLLNTKARIPLCGLVSHYNSQNLPTGPDRLSLLLSTILTKRLKVQGFIIFSDYGHRYDEFLQHMNGWVNEGKIKYREDIINGLENAPEAFIGLLEGRNFGKLVVQVSN
jgi:NADPH-dependent curcumin reductase CurA